MSEKPTRVEVGQRWQFETACRDVSPDEIRKFESNGRWVDAEGYSWRPEDLLASAKWTFLGYAPSPETGPPVMGETRVDWARWLPSAETPDTGGKKFKPGQVWATHVGTAGNSAVFLVGEGLDPYGQQICEYLAVAGYFAKGERKLGAGTVGGDSPFAEHAILVQDVGAEPTPPEVLYGRPPMETPAATPKAGPAPMPPLGPGHPMHAMNESCHPTTGAALSALEAIQAKKPPEPWVPSVDDFDLLPDAGTSYRAPR